MEQQGKPISELLNSVAIIQQEMQNCQDPAKELELLGELKLLAARIYIETDFAMLSMAEFAEEIHELDLETDEEIVTEIEETEDEVREFVTDNTFVDVQEENTDEILPMEELVEQPVPDLFSMGSFVPEPSLFQPDENEDLLVNDINQVDTSAFLESHVLEEDTAVKLEPVISGAFETTVSEVDTNFEMPEVINETPVAVLLPMEEMVEEVAQISPVIEMPNAILESAIPVVENQIPEIDPPAVLMENTVLEEKVNEMEIPDVTQPIAVVEPPMLVIETPAVEVAPPAGSIEMPVGEIPPPALPGMNVEAIINQMPISRRFEFANLLFGGDVQRMGTFIHELLQSPSGSARMDIYERWYEENNWRRRDEAASDLLRLIKRIFPG